ncbi:amino acid ABC transporter substrate-binding protein [Pedobacter frigidisoli]|uniref:Amino acid ABC transporter substrate-binding protein n=1 Tax=Pedobacter frigidisoli TaxID=2530455 RepID=A0A4R0NYH6_9SPHI|nr:amino acid ABC transporter substrate-binding protein [Pedobacter frigidisoli]TCD07108.1 amino acid ABC transporter substrate-binding protein [Pedobacter frigidisoli]
MNFKRSYWVLVLSTLVLGACSPKIRTPKPEPSKPVEQDKPIEKKPVKKFTQASISLLVPFKLDELNLKTATKSDIEKYAMPIDFYQGFKLGLDSAASSGLNFKLNVFDTQDDNAHISLLYKNERFKQSNLIVGPVFPEGQKFITNYSKENNAMVVSPLAASGPSEFNNPNLISVVNNIELHGQKIASYITKNYNPTNTIVVLINPKKTEDEQFALPIKAYLKANTKFIVQEYVSSYAFETKMIKGKQYAVVLTSSDRAFVLPTIEKLLKLKNLPTGGYNINLFGHPNWVKQNYPADKLQALNTIISSSYKIDYKNAAVVTFIKKYRYKYGFEPGEYAFKGFDIGFYFGKLLATYGEDYKNYITKDKYKGLHNNFSFIHDEKLGYINTSVMLLKYKNFALNIIE